MNIFKALFGSTETNREEERKLEVTKRFNALKSDGMIALKSRQTALAVDFLQKAIEIHNDDLECIDCLSQALIAESRLPEAYEQLQILAEARPDNKLVFIRMADVAYMMEDYSAMSDACEKAVLIDDNDAQVMYLYARACIAQGDTSNGIAMLSKAIHLKDDYFDAYLLRGETLLKDGKTTDADSDADFLLEHIGDQEDVLLLKARIEQNKGNKEESLNWYSKVIDANPFSINAFRERAALKKELGDEVGASDDLKAMNELASEDGAEAKMSDKENFDIEREVNESYKNNPLGL
jgi:tetratricopeptide (TPR) repeat protein